MQVLLDPELKAAAKPLAPLPPADQNIQALTNNLLGQIRNQQAAAGRPNSGPAPKSSGPANTGTAGSRSRSQAAARGWQTRKGGASAASETAAQRQARLDARQAALDAQHNEDRQRNQARQDVTNAQHDQQFAESEAAKKAQAAQQQAAAAAAAQKQALASSMRRAAVPPPSDVPVANVARFNALGQIIQNNEASAQDWADWAYEGVVAGAVDPARVTAVLPPEAQASFQKQLTAFKTPNQGTVDRLASVVKYGGATPAQQNEYLAQRIALGAVPYSAIQGAPPGQMAALATRVSQLQGKTLSSPETKVAGVDTHPGGAERLRAYWLHGEGAGKIGWGAPHDFYRCVDHLTKYLGTRAKGYCAKRHHDATGMWPGDKRNKGLCCSDCAGYDLVHVNVAGMGLDAELRPEFKTQRTYLDPGKLHARSLRSWVTRRGGAPSEHLTQSGQMGNGAGTGTVSTRPVGPQVQSTVRTVERSGQMNSAVLPQRQAAFNARSQARQERLFGGGPPPSRSGGSGNSFPTRGSRPVPNRPEPPAPPPAPRLPDPSTLAPGSGVPGGRDTPLSDAEWGARQGYYNQMINTPEWRFGGPHDTSVANWDNRAQTWSEDRQVLHGQLLNQALQDAEDRGVGHDGHAVILGGLSGSGKSTALKDPDLMAQMGVDIGPDGKPTSHMVISADQFKEELVSAGAVDTMPGLTPLESSHLVHEESRLLAEALWRAAVSQHTNIVVDGTLGNYYLDRQRVGWLEHADPPYDIDGIFVDVSIPTALQGVNDRWRAGVDNYEVNGTGEGGRPVPSGFIDKAGFVAASAPDVPAPDGIMERPTTANRGTFQAFIDQGVFNTAVVLNNDGANRGNPQVVQSYEHPDLTQ